MHTGVPRRAPRPDHARDRYDRGAGRYDAATGLLERLRRLAVEALQLRDGQTVIDVACGTGLNLAALRAGVGHRGRVVGVDISAGMLERARGRVTTAGWRNVELIEGAVGDVPLPDADAALFSFTHDVLRTRAAVLSVATTLVPGGCVATTGVKYAARWAVPVNAAVGIAAPRFVTTTEGLERPWSHLEELVGPLEVRSLLLGAFYVAFGRRA
jgi:ubiquinone/menaquinone biosynthesis C-methylase UbiE